ncbi:MAG: hypothetical protein FD167_5928, partial [bacterium]
MKDYWRLIGLSSTETSDDQIRQAHFRTFRFYQGRKNESKNPSQQAVAELVIDYLRSAQYNADLPLPNSLKHLLSTVPQPLNQSLTNQTEFTKDIPATNPSLSASSPLFNTPPTPKVKTGFPEIPKTALPVAKPVPIEEIIPPTQKISVDLINKVVLSNEADETVPPTDDLNDPKKGKTANSVA